MTGLGVDQALRQALVVRSYAALAEALENSTFLVPLVAGPDGDAPVIATDADGDRTIPVFSGPDAVQGWGGVTHVVAVDGAELLRMTEVQGVDGVLLDPAGPSPARLSAQTLRELGQGLTRDEGGGLVLAGRMQVQAAQAPETLVAAVRAAATDLRTRVWIFERLTPAGSVLTVGVAGASEVAGDLAARLAHVPGLPVLDVIALEPTVVEHLSAALPMARL